MTRGASLGSRHTVLSRAFESRPQGRFSPPSPGHGTVHGWDNRRVRAAGFNVEAGTVLLAVVRRGGEGPPTPVPVTSPRLPPAHLPEGESLRDLAKRVKQELDAVQPRVPRPSTHLITHDCGQNVVTNAVLLDTQYGICSI